MIRRDWSFSCYTCDQVMGALSTRTRLLLVLMLGVVRAGLRNILMALKNYGDPTTT